MARAGRRASSRALLRVFDEPRLEPRPIRFTLDDEVIGIAGEAIDGALRADRVSKGGERYAAIQAVAGLMLRTVRDGGRALRVNPQSIDIRLSKDGTFTETPSALVVDALSLGYVWDEKAAPDNNPNVKRPKKNHRGDKYSHLMNGLEYIVLGEGLVHRATERTTELAKRRLQKAGAKVATQLRAEQGEESLMEAIARIDRINRANRRDPGEKAHQAMMRQRDWHQPHRPSGMRRGGY